MKQVTVLLMDDGTQYIGYSFGALAPRAHELLEGDGQPLGSPKGIGEVVFNTAMSGYHEVLTDPSYMGQLVAMTYPHIGNYGCDPQWSEIGPEEGNLTGVKPAAMIVRSLYTGPVPDGRMTLDEFLAQNGTPGITGVDTRALTLKLRQEGSRNALLLRPENGSQLAKAETDAGLRILHDFPAMEGRELIREVGSRKLVELNPEGSPHIALLDCGIKANIVRRLLARGCKVTIVPSDFAASQFESVGSDALFVSNGPGDPGVLAHQIELIKASIGKRPVLGICLGHQLIAEAVGAKTYKMKFGHHGVNHPVRDERTKRVFVTSQNHGFAVEENSLPEGCEVWFRNANDGSVEGIIIDDLRIRTTQFHPESAPGPHDSHWVFSSFLDVVGE